jgi:tetratricopeptide (TPR) repeat protein
MGLFFLLTLYCVIRSAGGSAHEIGWKVGAIASCVLGMGCKGVIVTAPIIVLLYDRAFLSKSWTELARKRWGLYAGLAATWVLYPLMLARAPEEWKETAGFAYGGVSPMQYAITQPAVILHYLRLVLWPDQLCLDYGWRAAQTAGEVIPEITMILGLIVATIWASFKKPAWGFPGAWFFVILVPTSSFIPIADLAVEHRMYLSLAAVIALCVIGLFLLFRRKIVIASWCIVAITVLALTGATIERNTAYASLISIWEDTVIKRPHSPRAQYDLADTLEQAGRIQEATEHYRLAVQENPSYTDALNNLGHVLYASGNFAEAETYLQRAVQLKPDLAIAHFNLGYVLAQLGKPQDALSELELAIKLKPDYVEARTNLGIVLAMSGRISGAIDEWEQAIRLDPRAAEAHSNLAFALSQTGEAREAISHYEEAIRLKPDYVNAQVGLARLLATLGPEHGGDPARAVTLASRACELTGYRVASHLDTLALSYAAAGRYDDAVKTETNAEQLALSSGQPELGRQFEANLARYRAYHR